MDQKQLQRHIQGHLQALFLMALPDSKLQCFMGKAHFSTSGVLDSQGSLHGTNPAFISSSVPSLSLACRADETQIISQWLAAPDPSTNHTVARKKHQPGTGDWILSKAAFMDWKTKPNTFLWLHGLGEVENNAHLQL